MSKQAEKLAKTTTFKMEPDAQPYKPGFWAVDYDPTQAQWTDTESELGGFNVDVQGPPDVEAVMPDVRARDLHTPPGPPGEAAWRMRQQVPSILKQSPKYDKDVPPPVVSGLSDATDTSVEVKSEEMSNWVVNAEKALQDMIKIEETDPTSRIQSAGQKPVVPEPSPLSIGDEGVVSQEESESMIAASKQGTHSKVNINNIIAIGAHGTLKSKRHPDAYRGGKGVDIIEGGLRTFLRVPKPKSYDEDAPVWNRPGRATGYNTPRLIDYGGLRMSGPEFMDASVEQSASRIPHPTTVPSTSVIMPHGITDAGESINYSGLYRGKGEKGQVGTDTIWISERADHGGLIGSEKFTDAKQPGDTAYHEPMHRFFHYLWRDYYDNEGKLSKGIKVKDAENKEVELLDLIFPKKDSNCNAKVCARIWNGKAMHDIIYSASKYKGMRKRVGSEGFGEATTLSDEDNLNRNVAIIKEINNALKDEAQKILRSKNMIPPHNA